MAPRRWRSRRDADERGGLVMATIEIPTRTLERAAATGNADSYKRNKMLGAGINPDKPFDERTTDDGRKLIISQEDDDSSGGF